MISKKVIDTYKERLDCSDQIEELSFIGCRLLDEVEYYMNLSPSGLRSLAAEKEMKIVSETQEIRKNLEPDTYCIQCTCGEDDNTDPDKTLPHKLWCPKEDE